MSDQYETIDGVTESKLVIKKSRFIGLATSTGNLESIEKFLSFVQSQFPDATHYCYAYKIKLVNQLCEYANDAGEPRNSAGQPILNTLRRNDLVNTVIFIIRYYGGKKLGIFEEPELVK